MYVYYYAYISHTYVHTTKEKLSLFSALFILFKINCNINMFT